MSTSWLGQSGNINDPSKYLGQPIDTTDLYQKLGPIVAFAFNVSAVTPQSDVSFGGRLVAGNHGPTKAGPNGDGLNNNAIQHTFLAAPYTTLPFPQAPGAFLQYEPASYAVSGAASVNSITANALAGSTITLAGSFTLAQATNPDLVGFGASGVGIVAITGTLDDLGYGVVGGNLRVSGKASFTNQAIADLGRGSLVFDYGASSIQAGGSIASAGLYVGAPQSYAGTNGNGVRLTVQGSLTDTDTATGIQVGVGTGAIGTLFVKSGEVTSKTVAIGGAGGDGTIELNTSGNLTNAGTIEVGQGGTLDDGGTIHTDFLTIDGVGHVDAGSIGITNAGTILVTATGTLEVLDAGQIHTPLLQTASGSTATFMGVTLNNAGVSAGSGANGLILNGTVDVSAASKVNAVANDASIVVGMSSAADPNGTGNVTATDSKVVANSTTIGAGESSDGALTLSGGSWVDQGIGTTMMVGAGGYATLILKANATLSDQDVAIGLNNGDGDTGGTAIARLTDGAVWTINGKLTVGGLGVTGLTVDAGASATVAGTVTINGDGPGQAKVGIIVAGSLGLGGAVSIDGGAALSVKPTGTVNDMSGLLTLNSGQVFVKTGQVDLGGLALEDPHAVVQVIQNGTLQTEGQGLKLDASGSHVRLDGGTLLAGAVTLAAGSYIVGNGTIGDLGAPGTTLSGGFGDLIAQNGLLAVGGSVDSTHLVINDGAALEVVTTLTNASVQFDGFDGLLEVDGTSGIDANVFGFAADDAIDIGQKITDARYVGGALILYNGSTEVSRFSLSGYDYSKTQFAVTPMVHNGNPLYQITISANGPTATTQTTGPHPTAPTSPGIGAATGVPVTPITDSTGTTVNVDVDDSNGLLDASDASGATLQSDGTHLSLSGTIAQVNQALATLTYTATTPGADTITLSSVDDQGGADSQSVSFTVADPGVTASVPGAQSVTAGTAAAIAGVSIADSLADPTPSFTVTLSDVTGALSATVAGSAVVSGAGSTTLSVSGDILSVNRTLASLTYDGVAGPASDSITISAADPFGGTAQQSIAVSVAAAVAPTETDWATADDGDAGTSSNWTAGVPTPAVTAVLTMGDYTVSGTLAAGKIVVQDNTTFTGAVSATGLAGDYRTFVVDAGGAATFDGDTLVTPSLVLSGPSGAAALSLIDGAVATLGGVGPLGQAESVYIGLDEGASGALIVAGATLNAATGMTLGDAGSAALTVSDGGVVTTGAAGGGYADITLGNAAGGFGDLAVDGAGSRFTGAAPIFVGVAGVGVIDITAAGTVTSQGPAGGASALVGYAGGGSGFVDIDGAGSTWDVTQILVAGYDGAAYLTVTGGGTLEVDGSLLRVGRDASGSGDIELYGPGSTLSAVNAQLALGRDGSAILSITGGAAANVASVLIGADADNVLASLTVGGGSVLNVSGAISYGASAQTVVSVDGGTIATGGGFAIGDGADDGTSDVVTLDTGGTITGGVSLLVGGTLAMDETVTLGGTVTMMGGVLQFSQTSAATGPSSLANAIVVQGSVEGTIDTLGTVDLTGPIAFVGPGADLQIDGAAIDGEVSGFVAGDTLDLENFSFTSQPDTATWANDVLSISSVRYGGGAVVEQFNLVGDYATTQFALAQDADGSGVDLTIACFAAGTRLRCERGAVAVESLTPSDRMVTLSGDLRRIRWIGHRRILAPSGAQSPVRVRAGAFGHGLPSRDLVLSPEHAVYAENVLVPIRALIDGDAIAVIERDEIVYHHVELDTHDVIFAEDLPCETYLDCRDHTRFENASSYVPRPPGDPFAPLRGQGPQVERLRALVSQGVSA